MRFKIFILISAFFSIFLFCPVQAADYGLEATVKATGGSLPTSIKGAKTIAELAGVIVNVALSMIGILFFILMLYAGITWMKAMGSTEDITKAKEMIIQAIIGLIIVMSAYAISNLVFTSLGASGGGGGGAPNPSSNIVNDGTKCDEKGNKWNCRGGSSVATCEKAKAFCDSPCRYDNSNSLCTTIANCQSGTKNTFGAPGVKCPFNPVAVCCKTTQVVTSPNTDY